MITMSTDAESLNIVALGKKIGKVNSVLPRHMQWFIYKCALVVIRCFNDRSCLSPGLFLPLRSPL